MEIKIPIEIVELEDNSFHIIVSLQIGSIEGDFIIDTGASVTVIDKLTPFSYEPLDDVSEINSGGVCGEINEVQLVNITALQIDNHTIENIHAAVIDLQYVNSLYDKHLQRRVAGLLGSDFLVRHEAVCEDGSSIWYEGDLEAKDQLSIEKLINAVGQLEDLRCDREEFAADVAAIDTALAAIKRLIELEYEKE